MAGNKPITAAWTFDDMASSIQTFNLMQYLKRTFPPGVVINVLPGENSYLTDAARMAGITVQPLDFTKWPFSGLIALYTSGGGGLRPTLIGKSETDFHDKVRDDFASNMNVNGAAITEVTMNALGTRLRADADIVGRSPNRPGDTPQVVVEVKTGMFSEIRINQRYIYALALIGEHLQSNDDRLPKVGLIPDVPLPAMDFLLVTADAPGADYKFALVKSSFVRTTMNTEQILAYLQLLELIK